MMFKLKIVIELVFKNKCPPSYSADASLKFEFFISMIDSSENKTPPYFDLVFEIYTFSMKITDYLFRVKTPPLFIDYIFLIVPSFNIILVFDIPKHPPFSEAKMS